MNRLLRIVYLWVILCTFIQTSDAQRYPITGNVVVLPPYSPYLTDMTNSIPDRINLSLLLLDANEPLEQIGLRLKINGPGISLETKPTFRPNPIDLSYNIPTQLSGFDLSEYFDPQNLRIEGLGLFQRTQFLNNPTLPEGLYTMCFEAFDYRRFDEAPASAEICFMFTIMIHEPPIIITPIGEQTPTQPQNLMFTWVPQHVGNFITNYTLYLYERTNPNDAPINVINGGGILIDSFQTMINSYNYTGVDPLLEYGTEYVIRVRAFDIDGAQVFDNLGYSPIEMFTYGGDCTAPYDLQGTPTERGEILLTWEGELPDINPGNGGSQTQTTASTGRTSTAGGTSPANSSPVGGIRGGSTSNPISGGLNPVTSSPSSNTTSSTSNSGNASAQFIIEYRNINAASGEWQRAYTYENTYTIPGMEMGQSYEVRVGLLCWGSIEVWSDIIEVQMPDFYCGIQPPSHDLANSLLNSLVSGDSVYAGDFKVTINEVYGGSNGRFTGTGYISVPYLNFARINVDFIAATFNEDYRLVDGFFDVKGIGAQGLGGDWLNWLDMLLEAVETLDDFLDLESMISGQISELLTFANTFMPPDIAQQLQDAQDALDNATTDGEIQDAMDLLNDAINAFNEAMEELLNASYVVFFENNGQSNYGHDRKASGSNEIATNYEDAFTIGGKGGNDSVSYTPDWKSVKTGDVESLKAVLDRELSNLSLWPNNTTFKTLDGTILPSSIYPDEDSISLTINGSTHENVMDVFAVENYTDADGNPLQHIAGKMKVLTLDPIEKKVWIVPVNGAEYPSDPAAVEAMLNKTYEGAAVNWTVQQINGFNSTFDDEMNNESSGWFSNFTDEMKLVRNEFKNANNNNVDDDIEYVIFVCKETDFTQNTGYMPRASHYGFLFENAINDDEQVFNKTIAHELGHGVFHLKHTWDEFGGQQGEGSTFNLMDRQPNGMDLRKWQWMHIHNPQGGTGIFQDDDDGQYITISNFKELFEPFKTDSVVSFISSMGTVVSIEYDSITQLIFATGGEKYATSGRLVPIGSLTFFTIKDGKDQAGNQKVIQYTNCGDGTYHVQTPSTTCDGALYSRIYSAPKPIILRPAYFNDKIAVHYGQIENYTPPSETPEYDFLKDYFFFKNSSGYFPADGFNTRNIDEEGSAFYLSADFNNPIYTAILAQNKSYADFTKLSSFYLNGISRTIHENNSYSGYCINEADVKGMLSLLNLIEMGSSLYFLARPYLRNIAPGANHDLSNKIENTIWEHKNSNYFSHPDLSEERIFDIIEVLFDRVKLIESYQTQINTIPNNATDEDIDELMYDAQDVLLQCEFDQLTLSYPIIERMIKHILVNEWLWVENVDENMILSLIDKVQADNYVEFLGFLDSTKVDDDYLWTKLINGVDNFWFDKNGSSLMEKLYTIYSTVCNSPTDNNYKKSINFLEQVLSRTDEGEYYLETKVDSSLAKIIPYNYTRILDRISFYFIGHPMIYFPPIPTTKVTLNDDGSMNILAKTKVFVFFYADGVNIDDTEYKIRPFDPIIVDKSSTFGIAKDFLDGNNLKIYPACLFYFFNHEATAQSTQDAIITALDVITIVTPGGALLKAGRLGKALIYADKVSSVLSIAGTATQDDNPEVSAILNGASAVLGMGSLGSQGILSARSKLKSIKATKQHKKVVETISKASTEADRVAGLNQMLTKILASNGDDALAILSKKQLEDLKKILTNDVDEIKQISPNTPTKVDDAIAKINAKLDGIVTLANRIGALKSALSFRQQKLIGWFENLWNKGILNLTKKDGFHDAVKVNYIDDAGNSHEIAHFGIQTENGPVEFIQNSNGVPNSYTKDDIKEAFTHSDDVPENAVNAGITCKNGACGLIDGACFVKGTLIKTITNYSKIEDLKVGDEIYAYDEINKEPKKRKIKSVFQKVGLKFAKIFSNGKSIESTSDHPFYIPKLKKYLPVDSLKKGMYLLAFSGSLLPIDSIQFESRVENVYNLEVENNYNYFVGQDEILAHNAISCIFKDIGITENMVTTLGNKAQDLLTELKTNTKLKAFFEAAQNTADLEARLRAYRKLHAYPTFRFNEVILGLTKGWPDNLFSKLDVEINLRAALKTEMASNPGLFIHFNGLFKGDEFWYKFGLLRDHITNGGTNLPTNFKQMLDDVVIPTGVTPHGGTRLGDLPSNNLSAELGKALEGELNNIFSSMNTGGISSIDNMPLPTAIKDNLKALYNDGYRIIMQSQLNINTKNPIPDYLFFKVGPNNLVDASAPVKYFDAKIHISTGFSTPQKELVKEFTNIANGTKTCTITSIGTNPYGITDGMTIFFNEIAKIGTKLKNGKIEFLKVIKKP